ncbi:MAG: hypothetical protein ABI947_17360 [Chloroflexota bacterium]
MSRRRIMLSVGLFVVIVLLALFIIVGIPLIRDTFATPIPGLPTTSAGSSSLRDRFTQTAAAKQGTVSPAETPQGVATTQP